MLGKVPPGVREALDCLDFNEEEYGYLKFIFDNMAYFSYYGGDEGVDRAIKGFAEDYVQKVGLPKQSIGELLLFVESKLCTFEQFEKLLDQDSLLVKYPRHSVFKNILADVLSGTLVGAPMMKLWSEQLELAQGNTLEAIVALEFLKSDTREEEN